MEGSKHRKTFGIKLLMLWTNLKEHRLKAPFCTEWSPWKVLEFVQKGYKPWLNRAFPEVHSQVLTGTTWSTYKKYLHRWLISGYRWWILRVSGVVWFCLRKTRLDTACCYSWWLKTTWHPPHGAVLSFSTKIGQPVWSRGTPVLFPC